MTPNVNVTADGNAGTGRNGDNGDKSMRTGSDGLAGHKTGAALCFF